MPTEDQARAAAAEEIKEYGELNDFRKTNGEQREIEGQRHYIYHFRAASTLGGGWVWDPGNIMRTTGLKRGTPQPASVWGPELTEVKNGATYVAKGTVTFRNTENGWEVNNVEIERYGYCSAQKPAECYAELWEKK